MYANQIILCICQTLEYDQIEYDQIEYDQNRVDGFPSCEVSTTRHEQSRTLGFDDSRQQRVK